MRVFLGILLAADLLLVACCAEDAEPPAAASTAEFLVAPPANLAASSPASPSASSPTHPEASPPTHPEASLPTKRLASPAPELLLVAREPSFKLPWLEWVGETGENRDTGASARRHHLVQSRRDGLSAATIDTSWWQVQAAVAVGEEVSVERAFSGPLAHYDPAIGEIDPMVSLGFVPDPHRPNVYTRRLNIPAESEMHRTPEEVLALFELPALPTVDSITISSIHRPHVPRDYIYDTLTSIFEVFPSGVQVNILVGNNDTAYLAPEKLAAEVGAKYLDAIHIFPPTAAMATELEGLDKVRRGSWNFARGLLSYRGTRGLILLEDDVSWARDGVRLLDGLVRAKRPDLVSLFNNFCHELPGRSAGGSWQDVALEYSADDFTTFYSQGFYVTKDVAADLGRHQLLRMNSVYWDGLLRTYVNSRDRKMTYAYPSLLQHQGIISSSGWGAAASSCFLDD